MGAPASARLERAVRIAAVLLGSAVALLAIAVDLLRSGGDGFGRTQLSLLLLGLLLIAAGVAGRRVPALHRGVALFFLNTIFILLLIELAAAAVLAMLPSQADPAAQALQNYHARIEALPYYATQPWASAFWEEHWAIERRQFYQPFVLWRLAPFEGRYVRIGADGLRRVPGANCGPDAFRVFVFGGSAAWGWGSPDSATIPAFLQQGLSARGMSVCIVSYAQNAYVSTQEIIELVRALQEREVPDLALFYDGYNDVRAAHDFGRAGSHLFLERIRERVQRDPATQPPDLLRTVVTGTKTFMLLRRLAARPPRPLGLGGPAAVTIADSIPVEQLSADVVRVYLANVEAARAMGARFGFSVLFIWQPILPEIDKPLAAEEVGMLANLGDMSLTSEVYERMRARSASSNLLDMQDVFAGDSAARWIDFVHLNPDGNRLVAARIESVIAAVLQQSSGARVRTSRGGSTAGPRR